MQIELKIDSSCTEPIVIIMTDSMTEEIKNIMDKLSENVKLSCRYYKSVVNFGCYFFKEKYRIAKT